MHPSTLQAPRIESGKIDILLVFVHGFLGSHESFKSFPNDLKLTFQSKFSNQISIDSLVYPAYETFGSNERQVQLLMDFLVLHGTSAKYKNVFLLAHSMGGLLSADAFKYLYKLDDADLDGTRSLASRIYKSLFTYQKSSSTSHTEDEMRSLVNISAILAFDSPYFGLHQNVITRTGLQKAKDAVPKELPPISGILGPAINGAVEHLIPNKVSLPIGTDISTQSLKETLKSNLTASSTDGSSSTAHPDPSALLDLGPTNLDLRKLTTGSIVVAPVILSTPAVGMTLAATAADRLVSLSQFLSPLLSSTSSSRARLGHLSRLHQSSSLYFRAYYNVLGHALLAHPQPTSACKTFCIQPLSHTLHFQPLPSPLSDEIDAHMFLFDAQEVGGEHYAWLLDTVAADILAAFTHVDVDAAANE